MISIDYNVSMLIAKTFNTVFTVFSYAINCAKYEANILIVA